VRKKSVVGAFVAGLLASTGQADEVASPKQTKTCEGLAASALRECLNRSHNVDKSATTEVRSPPSTAPNYVQHSSPVMITEEEKVVSKARDNGEDPKKALEKLRTTKPSASEKRDVK
jgi:hypothetical protein